MHIVIISERSVAIRALSRTRSKALFDAVFAENVAAGFDCGILEVPATNGTKC